jgi:hypothetical protein
MNAEIKGHSEHSSSKASASAETDSKRLRDLERLFDGSMKKEK